MKVPSTPVKRARIEMLPLIDIVFLLLVFFIYAMLSMAVHRGMPVKLPTSSTSELDQKQVLSITVRADGTVFVDKKRVPMHELTNKLKVLSRVSDERAGVLLFADRALPYQKLFHVLDRIRGAGIERISLQSEKEAGQ
jgi:biopolymer transport protein ExbD